MIGSANYTKASVGDEKNEKITLSYYVKECASIKKAEEMKALFDNLVEDKGGETVLTSNTKDKKSKKKSSKE